MHSRLGDVLLTYENEALLRQMEKKDFPFIVPDATMLIENPAAIVDKNARIGAGCVLRGDPSRPDQDGDGWCVRDGIVIVPKNAVLRPGTVV